ncbi:unnamed protein product [Ilex paraguariensis]|uniref:Uncharacterized protein n=1 Tax=Ilex paraguariensis TaxID=185542 RepID=A0ABC8UQJ4_9AQUA
MVWMLGGSTAVREVRDGEVSNLGALLLIKEAIDVSIGEVSKLRFITNGGLPACTVSGIVGDLDWKESSNLDKDEEEGELIGIRSGKSWDEVVGEKCGELEKGSGEFRRGEGGKWGDTIGKELSKWNDVREGEIDAHFEKVKSLTLSYLFKGDKEEK